MVTTDSGPVESNKVTSTEPGTTTTLENEKTASHQKTATADVASTSGDDAPNKEQKESKTGLRKLFGFGKKKDDLKDKDGNTQNRSDVSKTYPANLDLAPKSPSKHPYISRSPPLRGTPSPRLVSPAGSQIFERDVQESTTAAVPASPAIPSHIQTENHIPAVLSASTEAITDSQLSPDAVEIVMHSSHQPAIAAVGGVPSGTISPANDSGDVATHQDDETQATTYGTLDSSDVRRLSFISFADVVQSEQQEHARDPMSSSFHLSGLTAIPSPGQQRHRSPSPLRSGGSSQKFGSNSPTSKSGSVKGLEMASPNRAGRPLGSPVLSSQASGTGQSGAGELVVETVSQALRKAKSGELLGSGGSGTRSVPMSPVTTEAPEQKFPEMKS